MGSDDITAVSGKVVGQWNGTNVKDLQDELARIRSAFKQQREADKLAPSGMPHMDQLPEDLRSFTAYLIWGCDLAGNCLCEGNANRVVSVKDVRQYSLIDHH